MMGIQDMMTKQAGGQMFKKFAPQMTALAEIVAQRERAQLELAQRLTEASDVDASIDAIPDAEDRAEQLEAMAEAAAHQDLQSWYFGEFAPDRLDNPEQAAAYAGLHEDEWESQKAAWADNYRAASPDAEAFSDEALAGSHVETTFGVSLKEFEANVVFWRPGEAIRDVLTTNLATVEAAMEAVADDLEGDE